MPTKVVPFPHLYYHGSLEPTVELSCSFARVNSLPAKHYPWPQCKFCLFGSLSLLLEESHMTRNGASHLAINISLRSSKFLSNYILFAESLLLVSLNSRCAQTFGEVIRKLRYVQSSIWSLHLNQTFFDRNQLESLLRFRSSACNYLPKRFCISPIFISPQNSQPRSTQIQI